MTSGVVVVMDGWRGLHVFFKTFCKTSAWFSNIFFFTVDSVTLISVDHPTFFEDGVFVFKDDSWLVLSQFCKCLEFFLGDILPGGGWVFAGPLMPALSSSASCCSRLWQACSTAAMYSPKGRCLGATVKLDPWVTSETWALVRGTLERFLTNFSTCRVVSVVGIVVAVVKYQCSFGGHLCGLSSHIYGLQCWSNYQNLNSSNSPTTSGPWWPPIHTWFYNI